MATIQDLYDFINTAQKNRKYVDNTAQGLRAALKLFEKELNSEEKNSIDTLESNLEEIYRNVFLKNKNNYGADSLLVYKRRINKIISDYRKYGIDPHKMASWSVKTVIRSPRTPKGIKDKEQISNSNEFPGTDSTSGTGGSSPYHKIEIALGNSITKSVLIIPKDMKKSDAAILKSIIDNLVQDE